MGDQLSVNAANDFSSASLGRSVMLRHSSSELGAGEDWEYKIGCSEIGLSPTH